MCKRFLAAMLALALALIPAAVSGEGAVLEDTVPAEEWTPAEGWLYLTWLDGGITWVAPADTQLPELTEDEQAFHLVMRAENPDYRLQVRRYAPAEMTFELYCAILTEEEATQVTLHTNGYANVAFYRNTNTNADSELCGAVITGLDGSLYKLSVFAGESGDIGEEAPVWEIAQTLASTLTVMDLETWLAQREVS